MDCSDILIDKLFEVITEAKTKGRLLFVINTYDLAVRLPGEKESFTLHFSDTGDSILIDDVFWLYKKDGRKNAIKLYKFLFNYHKNCIKKLKRKQERRFLEKISK